MCIKKTQYVLFKLSGLFFNASLVLCVRRGVWWGRMSWSYIFIQRLRFKAHLTIQPWTDSHQTALCCPLTHQSTSTRAEQLQRISLNGEPCWPQSTEGDMSRLGVTLVGWLSGWLAFRHSPREAAGRCSYCSQATATWIYEATGTLCLSANIFSI